MTRTHTKLGLKRSVIRLAALAVTVATPGAVGAISAPEPAQAANAAAALHGYTWKNRCAWKWSNGCVKQGWGFGSTASDTSTTTGGSPCIRPAG